MFSIVDKSLIVSAKRFFTKKYFSHMGRCNEATTCDVKMDKSKYFHIFVKFSVGNVSI